MQVGTTLEGRFALLSRADYDLPGVTRYLARDIRLDSDVIVDEVSSVAPSAVRRQALRTLAVRDAHLTRTLSASSDAGTTYIATERSPGICLAAVLGERRIDEARARAIIGEAARGLLVASAQGLHHGWLRPECLFVNDRGLVSVRGLAVEGELALQAGLRRGRGESADATALARLFLAAVTGKEPDTATEADLPELGPAARALCDGAIAGSTVPSLAAILDAVGGFDSRSLQSFPHAWRSLRRSLDEERAASRQRTTARASAARAALARAPAEDAEDALHIDPATSHWAAVMADAKEVPLVTPATEVVPAADQPLTPDAIDELHDLYTFDAMVEEQMAARGPTTQELFYERLHERWPRSRAITRRLDLAHERAIRGGPINAGPIMLGLSVVALVVLAVIALSLLTHTPSVDTPDSKQRLRHYPEFTQGP